MVDTRVQASTTPAPLQAVALQAVPPPAAIQPSDPLAMYQNGSQAGGVVGNAVVENRRDNGVMQQLRWLEKMVYVCIALAFIAIFKK